jgi:site-specific DNA recombinase
MANTKQIGIWLRVSTDDQVKGESLDVHEARARSYADSKGWSITEVYRLEAVSGKKVRDHPEARRMLSDIKSGHISGLIFSKLARLSRNNRELLDFAEIFQNHNADLISLSESIDTSTPAGRMFFSMIAALCNWEREEIVARVRASVPIRAAMGRSLGGQAQYGYAWEGKKFVLVPEEAAVRKLMYELYLEHRRFRTVARELNERGYRTRHNAKWAGTTIERLMRDPTAMGKKRFNFSRIPEGQVTWVAKPESEWVYHDCPAIVSPELWTEVNDLLTEKKLAGVRQSRSAVTLFGGLCYCLCNAKMYVPSNMKKYVCGMKGCKRKIPIDTLEAIFQSELDTFAFSHDTLASFQAKTVSELTRINELMLSNAAMGENLNKQIDSLLALYQNQRLDGEAFTKRYEPLKVRLFELEAEQAILKLQTHKLTTDISRGEEALIETQGIAERYPDMPFAERRRLVETVVERVTVDDDSVEFCYLFDPRT